MDSAVVAARRAIALDPEFAPGHAALGWALDYLGDRDAALEAHLRAVQLNPNLSDGLANLYHYGFGRMDEAARWWRPVLEADPTSFFLVWLVGRTYLHLGMPALARPLFEKTIALRPEFPLSYYDLGLTFILEGRPEEARVQIRRTLAAMNGNLDALVFAGQVEAALGDLPQSRRYFEQAVVHMPADSVWIWYHSGLALAWFLRQAGETERARGLVRSAAAEFEKQWHGRPRRLEDYGDLARIRVLEGNREGALRLMEEAVRQGWRFIYDRPNDPVLGSLRGDPRFDRLMAEVKADVDRQRARVEREGW